MNIPSRVNPFGYDNSTPPGYMRAEFLESTGKQRIDTGIVPPHLSGVKLVATYLPQPENADNYIFGCQTNSGITKYHYNFKNGSVAFGWDRLIMPLVTIEDNEKAILSANYKNDGKYIVNNVQYGELPEWTFTASFRAFIFQSSFKSNTTFDPARPVRIWSCEMTVDKDIIRNYVPALDSAGSPCMFDLVSKQPFRNEGSGQFTVGLTPAQALNLANLPATGGSMTISIPLEAAFDAGVESALNAAADKGWTITVQYRESELTTKNIPADFLESDGIATMSLPFESKNKSFVCEHTLGMPKTTSGLYTYGGSSVSVGYGPRYNADAQGLAFSDREAIRAGSFLRGGKYKIGWQVRPAETSDFYFGLLYEGEVLSEFQQWFNQYWQNVYNVFSSTQYGSKIGGATYELSINIEGSSVKYVPAIDSTGDPCLYDSASGENFYKDGEGSFIVGFDTTEKAAISISKLPVTSGGTLTVSLPAEAEDTATWVPAAIEIATNRGWTIVAQYRTN